MEFLASSFHPPAVDAAAAAATAAATTTTTTPRYPAWVLLDRKAYIDHRENATTAKATSSTGCTVHVTFCLADPPAVSHFCVHVPEFNLENFAAEPQVLFSEKDLVLLGFVFAVGSGSTARDCLHTEYFIYKAGRGEPSLQAIPATPPGTKNSLYVSIVLCDGGDEGEFFLADLSATTTLGHYELSIFSSKMEKWTTRTLELHASVGGIRVVDMFIVPHKVIALGGGMVGWVDLWRGIIVCNILAEEPFIYFIPLPKPDFNLARNGDPKPIRDVSCHNGVIKFVEMDHCFREEVVNCSKRFKVTKDLDSVDKMYDRNILLLPHEDFMEPLVEKITYIPDGWKIRTCDRHIFWDHWRKGHNVHVDDILASNPKQYALLAQLLDGCGKSALRNLTTAYPTLSLKDDDVVYLMSKVGFHDKNAWIVGVDLGNKTVGTLEPYDSERASYFKPDCLPYAFSEFLNTTPRSCAGEAVIASNEALNSAQHDRLSSGCSVEAPGYTCSNSQQQPPLLSNLPLPLDLKNLTSSESGHVNPVNSQSMDHPVLSSDAHGQLWLSVPLGMSFLSQLLQLGVGSANASFASLMPQKSVPEVQVDGGPAHVFSTLLRMAPANFISKPLGMPAAPGLQPKDDSNISMLRGIPALSVNDASCELYWKSISGSLDLLRESSSMSV